MARITEGAARAYLESNGLAVLTQGRRDPQGWRFRAILPPPAPATEQTVVVWGNEGADGRVSAGFRRVP